MFEIGASLREARSRQGVDFETMELRTKVRAKYLRFLEEERFDQLPGDTYTKGFLRVYADALGLNGQLYVDEFNSRFLVSDEAAVARPRRVQESRRRSHHRRESRLVLLVLGAIVIATALVIAAWRSGGADAPSVQGLGDAAANVPLSAAVQRVRLEIRAVRGPSYMVVRAKGRRGPQLYSGTLEEGQVQRFTNKSLFLSLASPRNVVVKLNGNRLLVDTSGELSVGAASAVRG